MWPPRSTVCALIAFITLADAFHAPPQRLTLAAGVRTSATPFAAVGRTAVGRQASAMKAAPKAAKKGAPERPERVPGVTLGMFLNPVNPYSWAIYFVVLINVFAVINQK
ncbi:hypothetical protein T492DRAFT_1037782 [Pavlovales sp. CCMP2436]|nr:hypothetical protein T492DRAFT_1037782 [Pavlovales sp. CCMP2436]